MSKGSQLARGKKKAGGVTPRERGTRGNDWRKRQFRLPLLKCTAVKFEVFRERARSRSRRKRDTDSEPIAGG